MNIGATVASVDMVPDEPDSCEPQAQGAQEPTTWYQSALRGLRGVAAAIGAQPGERFRLDLFRGASHI